MHSNKSDPLSKIYRHSEERFSVLYWKVSLKSTTFFHSIALLENLMLFHLTESESLCDDLPLSYLQSKQKIRFFLTLVVNNSGINDCIGNRRRVLKTKRYFIWDTVNGFWRKIFFELKFLTEKRHKFALLRILG